MSRILSVTVALITFFVTKECLSFFHLNVQCLRNKVQKLEVFLNDISPDIILISEHWLSKAPEL